MRFSDIDHDAHGAVPLPRDQRLLAARARTARQQRTPPAGGTARSSDWSAPARPVAALPQPRAAAASAPLRPAARPTAGTPQPRAAVASAPARTRARSPAIAAAQPPAYRGSAVPASPSAARPRPPTSNLGLVAAPPTAARHATTAVARAFRSHGSPELEDGAYRPERGANTAKTRRAALGFAPRRARSWALWSIGSFAAVALVAAGYLGALVQVGTRRLDAKTPRSAVSQSKQAQHAPPQARDAATVRAVATSAVSHSAPAAQPAPVVQPRGRINDGVSRAARAKAAALATAALEREAYRQPQQQVVTVRALSANEAPPTPATRAPAAVGGEPATRPGRDDVQQGLAALRPQLVACAAGQHGSVDAQLTIAASGRVTYSVISGDFKASPAACMARALRTARFASFSGPSLTVRFPYSL
jgi:hypothetical protein